MDKWFYPTLYRACDYFSMLGLTLTHVSKWDPHDKYWHREIPWFDPSSSDPTHVSNHKLIMSVLITKLNVFSFKFLVQIKFCLLDKIIQNDTWWCHRMEMHFTLLALCEKNPAVIGVLMCYLVLAWTSSWTNSWVASDLRCHDVHVTLLLWNQISQSPFGTPWLVGPSALEYNDTTHTDQSNWQCINTMEY